MCLPLCWFRLHGFLSASKLKLFKHILSSVCKSHTRYEWLPVASVFDSDGSITNHIIRHWSIFTIRSTVVTVSVATPIFTSVFPIVNRNSISYYFFINVFFCVKSTFTVRRSANYHIKLSNLITGTVAYIYLVCQMLNLRPSVFSKT